ncbi:DJ-1/PfpI family protein [Methanoregula sp. PtaB.Bin085]|uniref:DJ-1/PfpI family protein n=1 Tax=Methanoregula sp. PtaB.Bin085 TaxID=1811680 RepID=UPI0009CF54FE|nr:DJ-1/PfpI family protein [Methanoregula sp. PtaB.Bin085]OPX64548.1 MAG: Intracellular protease 1 [Methanoregula sp. PtaB.Bin085]
MKIAFVIYDGITLLDFAGVFDPLTRLKTMGFLDTLQWDLCARTSAVRSTEGVVLTPDRVDKNLAEYDFVIVPGGDGIKGLMQDKAFLRWISVASDTTTVAALCGGSLLLGAAGMLRTKRATTHPALAVFLKNFACEVVPDRIVDEGNVITAGGVTAGIDLGLYLCGKIAGEEVREKIQQQMDYRNYTVR